MTLLILSTVSVTFVFIVTILVIQIKSSLNATKIEQDKLLKLVENTSELNKQLTQIVADNTKNQTESSQILKSQVDNLNETTASVLTNLTELDKANTQTREALSSAIEGSNNQQQETLQALREKLEAVYGVSNQVENLTKTTEKLESHLTLLNQANTQTRDSLRSALEGSNNQQQESLQALSDKLESVCGVCSQVENLTKTIEKLESHLNLLDQANVQTRESLTETLEGTKNQQQQTLQALSDKLEAVYGVPSRIDNLTQTTEKLESHLNLLDQANTQTRESLRSALEGTNNQQQQALQVLSDKLESVSEVSTQVENLTKTTEKLESHLDLLNQASTQSKNNTNQEDVDAQLSIQQEQLKVVVEILETMKTQIDHVVKTVTKLESSLIQQPLQAKRPKSRASTTTKKST